MFLVFNRNLDLAQCAYKIRNKKLYIVSYFLFCIVTCGYTNNVNLSVIVLALKTAGVVSTFRTVYSARLQENPVLLSIKGTMWTVFTWHTTGGKVHVENITTDGAENENIWRTVIICFSVGPRYFKRFMYWQKHYAIRATNEKNFPYNIYIFFFCLYFFNTVLSPKKNNVR